MVTSKIKFLVVILLSSCNIHLSRGHNEVSKEHHRVRRGPAVWGAPVPDYSAVKLDGDSTYIYGILFLDARITDHYNNNTLRVKEEIMRLAREANKYFYQLNIKLVVVDILPTYRNDLSLYSFEEYRLSKSNLLPYHDFAALISYRYAGGLAFVNGMCSSKSVMLSGFYPHSPQAMGSIFFHEVSHLLGVSHADSKSPINVPHCACPQDPRVAQTPESTKQTIASSFVTENGNGCLRIPGFDHNCTVQLLANVLYRNHCLSKRERSMAQNKAEGFPVESSTDSKVLHICGNGVVEGPEECDCGLESKCGAWNCEPVSCTRLIPVWKIVLFGIATFFTLIAALIIYIRLRTKTYYAAKKPMSFSAPEPKLSAVGLLPGATDSFLAKLNPFRCIFKGADGKSKNKKKPECLRSTKLDPASIIIVRDASCLTAYGKTSLTSVPTPNHKIQRPRCPPPSRPNNNTLTRPKALPPRPPPPHARPPNHNITYKFADFDDD